MEKKCLSCSEIKPITEYYKQKRGLFGVRSRCKRCMVAASKERVATWRLKNKERYHAHAKTWAEKNPDRVAQIRHDNYAKNKDKKAEYSRQWGKQNKDRKNATRKIWRESNREKDISYTRKWQSNNPHIVRAIATLRRASQLNATPSWANHEAIKEVYRERLELQRRTGVKYHVDHIVPLRSKVVCGLHVEWNLRVIPASENQRKSNTHWPDMP